MRVRLPALIALVSAAAYVACGSDDGSKAVQEGGAGGEAGEAPTTMGGKSAAGSQNNAGTPNGGEPSAGTNSAAGTAGAGGAGAGGVDAGAGAGGLGTAGAGGESGDPFATPAACPGGPYTLLVGTSEPDTFGSEEVSGAKLIFGLSGDDIFEYDTSGFDCLVGGPGNDDFTNPSENDNYYVGGPGADTYHIDHTGNYVHIADMAAGDTIALSLGAFDFLQGVAGSTPSTNNLKSVPGYSTGTTSGVTEGTTIIYDPTSGELWLDWDGGIKGSSASDQQILTILNKDGYTFDINDFVLED
jgi:hypothetical protein